MRIQFPTKIIHLVARLAMIGVGLAGLVVLIAWLSGMFEEKIEPSWSEQGLAKYEGEPTDVVHDVTKMYIEEAVGTLKASSRTVVSAKVLATIESIEVTAGDQVEKGQVLIRLDSKEYVTRLDQAKQALEAAIAVETQAQNEFDRIAALLPRKAASQSEYDRAMRDLQVAKANVLKSRQAITESEVLLSYTTIVAAKNGRIVDRYAEPGDIARPGEPILMLYDATSLRLEAPVMAQLAVNLRVGDQLSVYVDALQKEFPAVVDEIVPQADAPSRSFLVKASVPRSDDLYEGMFGRLRIPAGERRHLCLAMDAIVRIGQLEFADVVLDDGTIERRMIKTGQVGAPGRQEVLSGLQAGERVILHDVNAATGENNGDAQH